MKNTVLRDMDEEGGLGGGEGNISIIKSNSGKQKTSSKKKETGLRNIIKTFLQKA